MTRKLIDCRDFPGPCSLAISADGPELRERIRAGLKGARDEAPVR